eukprot:CAMPEP_0185904148 /NCGR_PEP_ID=MMETSP0196C-20130402/3455_1 /TAXON_ID=2932 /ORGANISM="Alexandrium fundyense, Strain CCMP1719" /LENGTH=123 /DNA_ID=CAMNT_0028623385 /DNA_START=1 /DNA_END=369 /DNA_ORIENTATION=+
MLVILLAVYAGISVGVVSLVSGSLSASSRLARKAGVKPHGHGLFANLAWPWPVRGLTSLLLVLFAVVPIVVIITCFIMGPVLALAEGWSALAGIEYLLSNALQLAVPLTGGCALQLRAPRSPC